LGKKNGLNGRVGGGVIRRGNLVKDRSPFRGRCKKQPEDKEGYKRNPVEGSPLIVKISLQKEGSNGNEPKFKNWTKRRGGREGQPGYCGAPGPE